jgi:hypothetical protein
MSVPGVKGEIRGSELSDARIRIQESESNANPHFSDMKEKLLVLFEGTL